MVRAIPLAARGVVDSAHQRWQYEQGTPYVPSPVLVGDRLYFTQTNEPFLTCLDARTGKVLIDRRRLSRVHSFYASPVAVAGRLYLVDREGTTLVLKLGDRLEVLAVNPLAEPIDASPAVVGSQLFLRGEKHLYCIEER
jgi:outer membrane protein assembly factor BamB